jgi:hypothetical protein
MYHIFHLTLIDLGLLCWSVEKTLVSDFTSTAVIFYDYDYDHLLYLVTCAFFDFEGSGSWYLPTHVKILFHWYLVCLLVWQRRILYLAPSPMLSQQKIEVVPTGYLPSCCVPWYRWYLTPSCTILHDCDVCCISRLLQRFFPSKKLRYK